MALIERSSHRPPPALQSCGSGQHKERTMTRNQHVPAHGKNVRKWQHGELPMPDWVPRHMASGIEANGTFEIRTDLGQIRVHPGNIIVERSDAVWVCEKHEAEPPRVFRRLLIESQAAMA
jgi:hypothetical protein